MKKESTLILFIKFRNGIAVGFISLCAHLATPTLDFGLWTLDFTLAQVLKVKDTLRSTVNLTFDGQVIKAYHGPQAQERFENEIRVLRHLETRGCNFVPRLIEVDPVEPHIVTTSCGSRVERIDEERMKELLAELEQYGVRHDDPDPRNVTYRQSDGRFCLVDFEMATILPEEGPKPPQ